MSKRCSAVALRALTDLAAPRSLQAAAATPEAGAKTAKRQVPVVAVPAAASGVGAAHNCALYLACSDEAGVGEPWAS